MDKVQFFTFKPVYSMEKMTRWRVEALSNRPIYKRTYTPNNILVSLILGGYFVVFLKLYEI